MPPPLLQLAEIALTFGGAPLLDGVDLNVGPGERVCVVGRNGSGKSTLLKGAGSRDALHSAQRDHPLPVAGTRLLRPAALPGISAVAKPLKRAFANVDAQLTKWINHAQLAA